MLSSALLALQVRTAWTEVAQPFVSQHSQCFGNVESEWRPCFEWATAVVAAYSFELGDDKYQVHQAYRRESQAATIRLVAQQLVSRQAAAHHMDASVIVAKWCGTASTYARANLVPCSSNAGNRAAVGCSEPRHRAL
jgi:hypothetical protein